MAVEPRRRVSGGGTAAETLTVEVEGLASNGHGVARLPEGKVVFVPRTVPGDVVEVHPTAERPRWMQARVVRLVHAAPQRLEAPCPLFDRCGGCALQHVPYQEQLVWKGRFVADALTRIGGLSATPPSVRPSPREFRYRNRMTFTLRRLRGGAVVAGLHELEAPSRVLDVHGECLLPEEPILRAWTALRAAWGAGARRLPAGGRLRLTLRGADNGVVLLVRGGAPGWDGDGLLDDVAGLRAIWHEGASEEGYRRVAGGEALERWGEERLGLEGGAFLQVNRGAAEALAERVLGSVGSAGTGATAVDAYSGVGLYARALARRGWRVTAIEADPAACAAAGADAPAGLRVLEGRVEHRLGEALPADLVILNPPRTGLAGELPGMLLEGRPARVIYVSCDPATLARDLARMSAGYALTDLAAFDLFPQTAHVESVAVLDAL